jgi:hypothetical protein
LTAIATPSAAAPRHDGHADGVWFFDGNRDLAKGISFTNVPQPEEVGGVRDLTSDAADPFTLDCATVVDCNDGNPCTVDACDAATGVCSYTNVPDATSCADGTVCNGNEVCTAGARQIGTPLSATATSTTDSRDAKLGCQFRRWPMVPM